MTSRLGWSSWCWMRIYIMVLWVAMLVYVAWRLGVVRCGVIQARSNNLLIDTLKIGTHFKYIVITGGRDSALILLFLADIVCGDKMKYNALDFYVRNSNGHSWSWSNLFLSEKIFCTFTMQLKCSDVSSKMLWCSISRQKKVREHL